MLRARSRARSGHLGGLTYLYRSLIKGFSTGRNGYLHNFAAANLNQLSTGTTPVTVATDPVGLVFDTRLGLRASTKGAYMAGATGTYLSSPDSVAASITGDIDIDAYAYLTDWTPSQEQSFVAKYSTAGLRGYKLSVAITTGLLNLTWSSDGTATITKASTVAPTVSDGGALYVRATLDVDNGAGGNTVTFYTSVDGSSWTQLGDAVVTAGTTSLVDNAVNLNIGAHADGGGTPSLANVSGKIYSARIYNGIRESGGTLAVSFKGTDYVTGSTLTSSTTGEVWTRNGAAYFAPDGNHAIQATAAARPTWQVDAGGKYYLSFLGTDDSLTSATGGGGTLGFFWCGVVQPTGGAGTARQIFTDMSGGVNGYSVRLTGANKIALGAGNGAAETLLSSTATVNVGTKYLLTVWDDGVNLNVQINSATVETVARPVVTAGTARITVAKNNEAASEHLIGNLYPDVYWKDTAGTAAERANAQAYARMMGGL